MVKILMVDDHPIILEAYRNVLSKKLGDNLVIDFASDCDSAINYLSSGDIGNYDIVFLDLNIPPSKSNNILSGEELASFIKSNWPDVKIIIITAIPENYRIRRILNTINPDGFLIKGQTDSEKIIEAYNAVITDKTYYSKQVLSLLQSQITNNYQLDIQDKKILYYLGRGVRTNQLPDLLSLSLRAIENRKRKLKILFEAESKGDTDLLSKARQLGYI